MRLKLKDSIFLPEHTRPGGFDHAAIHRSSARMYVAHTANDAVDVVDCVSDQYLYSITDLTAVAGVLVSDEQDLVFTSNRGEDTVSFFGPIDTSGGDKVQVGIRPNGLSFDPTRGILLAANVGNPEIPDSFTLSIVNAIQRSLLTSIPVPGRTRWTIFDPETSMFYVNIAAPAQIVLIDAAQPNRIARTFEIPPLGPHGLDLDQKGRRLFCACDDAQLVTLDADRGNILNQLPLSGAPDVIFYHASLQRLYVAVGDQGVIDVIDTSTMQRLGSVQTEEGAHTIALDVDRNKVYAFLPGSHRVTVFVDQ